MSRSSRGSSHEREQRLHDLLDKPGIERERLIQAFLSPPLTVKPYLVSRQTRATAPRAKQSLSTDRLALYTVHAGLEAPRVRLVPAERSEGCCQGWPAV